MSTWTAPITWSVGQTVTKAQMDAEIRDHLNWLKGFVDQATNSTGTDTGPPTQLVASGTITSGATVNSLDLTGGGYIQMIERSDPANAAANAGRLYLRDNGSGKTQLVIIFSSGAVQVIATQP